MKSQASSTCRDCACARCARAFAMLAALFHSNATHVFTSRCPRTFWPQRGFAALNASRHSVKAETERPEEPGPEDCCQVPLHSTSQIITRVGKLDVRCAYDAIRHASTNSTFNHDFGFCESCEVYRYTVQVCTACRAVHMACTAIRARENRLVILS